MVHCLHCGNEFDALDMQGSYLHRTCPKCGHILCEESYDAHGRQLAAEKQAAKLKETELVRQVRACQDDVESKRWWQFVARITCILRAQKAENALEDVRVRIDQLDKNLEQLAYDRYGISEWFQLTHTPLEIRDAHGKVECQLRVFYSNAGLFRLSGDSELGGGYEGEFSVFEALRKRVVDPSSELFGAMLLPNLYVPGVSCSRDAGTASTRQVDCVVATDKCAFVIEVKNWRSHVKVEEAQQKLLVARGGHGENRFSPAEDILHQVREGARAFASVAGYAQDRVYRLVVFVHPLSLKNDEAGFCGRMLVSRCESYSGPFTKAMEDQMKELDSIMVAEQNQVKAERLLQEYGDLSGKFRLQARERHASAVRFAAANPLPSQGTRAGSVRKRNRRKRAQGYKGGKPARRRLETRAIDLSEWDWWFEERNAG